MAGYFGIKDGSAPLAATQAVIFEKRFRERFRDKSIIPLVTNRDWQGKFRGTGTEIDIPVLPVLHSEKTTPGARLSYQRPKASMEKFRIGRERYIALTVEDEDKLFAGFNIEGPILEEAAKVMSEDVEAEFWGDVLTKCHAENAGNAAGHSSGHYRLGTASTPQTLFSAKASPGTNEMNAVDYIMQFPACIKEQPGGKEKPLRIVVPTVVGYLLQTGELKQADLTGDATSMLRKDLQVIGKLGGADVIVSDKIGGSGAGTDRVYPVVAVDTSAITFAEEVRINDKLKAAEEFGDFHRTKMIYDWFVRYPEFFSVGYVKVG